MSYDGRLMRQALARFDEDKQRRAENFRARERAVYTKCPRIEEIDRELSHTMAKIIASGLRRGTDPRPAIEALREENLNLQQEKRLLLTRLGLPGDYLEEKPKCSRCNDTGFLGSEVCSCLRGYYAKEQNKELSGLLDLGSQCFENFNFDYYSSVPDEDLGVSPRTNMERVYDICQDYAHEFSPKSGNLLLTGGTGLGKTFLSASIARVVSASGHSVVYDTAGHIFARLSMLAEKSVARSVRQRSAMAPVSSPVPQAHSSTASSGVMRELTAAMSALCVSLLKMSAKRS